MGLKLIRSEQRRDGKEEDLEDGGYGKVGLWV